MGKRRYPEETVHYHFYVLEDEMEDMDDPLAEIGQRRRREYRRPDYDRRRRPVRRRPIYAPPEYRYRCPSGTSAYYVRSGDTLYDLAIQFGVDLNDIIDANPNIDPDNLEVGQLICIPRY